MPQSIKKLQRKALGHVPARDPELPLSPALADGQLSPLPFSLALLRRPRGRRRLATVRGECLPLLDLNICPGPEAGKGMAGHSKAPQKEARDSS